MQARAARSLNALCLAAPQLPLLWQSNAEIVQGLVCIKLDDLQS